MCGSLLRAIVPDFWSRDAVAVVWVKREGIVDYPVSSDKIDNGSPKGVPMKPMFSGLVSLTLSFAVIGAEPDHSKVPGVRIDYSPASSKQYIGSPSLAFLPNGDYVASHDLFGPGSTKDKTVVFRSTDKGKTWTKQATLDGQWWSNLFTHRDKLYILGVSKEYGNVVIRQSSDGGKTWTTPKDNKSGLLLEGKYHCAPVPVVVHKGKLWRAMEDAEGPGGWGSHFRAFMLSVPEDADLLKAESWTASNRIGRDPNLLDGKFGGWLEGNAVVTPQNTLVNVLRVDYRPHDGKAAMIEVSEDGKTAKFDAKSGFIDFPGGCKKFTIRYDAKSKQYWSLSNWVPPCHVGPNPERARNTLALISSPDLQKWEIRCVVLYNPDTKQHGFQYVDWLFDGDDIAAVCRTAHDDGIGGAHNQHDANYMTFHRWKAFRTLKLSDSVVDMKVLNAAPK